MAEKSPLFLRTIELIKEIPKGKVLTYSEVARLISAPGCARHISYILSSSSKKHGLPWHRVINAKGQISLPKPGPYSRQKRLLLAEKILFTKESIDLKQYLWTPKKNQVQQILKGLPLHTPLKAR